MRQNFVRNFGVSAATGSIWQQCAILQAKQTKLSFSPLLTLAVPCWDLSKSMLGRGCCDSAESDPSCVSLFLNLGVLFIYRLLAPSPVHHYWKHKHALCSLPSFFFYALFYKSDSDYALLTHRNTTAANKQHFWASLFLFDFLLLFCLPLIHFGEIRKKTTQNRFFFR